MRPHISVIITTFNERGELERTIDSVVRNTTSLAEIIVVDDGSTEGGCAELSEGAVHVLRNDTRTGIAFSRLRGAAVASGNVLCFLDSHQRVSRRCLDHCATYALDHQCIATPDIADFGLLKWRMHGADFELCPERGFFSARWRRWFQVRRITRVSGLRAPPYLIPTDLFQKVAWSPMLRGWGASEACVCVKAFFTRTPIVHLRGPLSKHWFRPQSGHFPVTWAEFYRNQAIIARICFSDATWAEYWRPLFAPHLDERTQAELASPELDLERCRFEAIKVRDDRDFWLEMGGREPPRLPDRGGLLN